MSICDGDVKLLTLSMRFHLDMATPKGTEMRPVLKISTTRD